MTYSKGGRMISITHQDLFGGKRPGLYIGTGNELLKVATFGSKEKADKFEEFLEFFFGSSLVKEKNPDGRE